MWYTLNSEGSSVGPHTTGELRSLVKEAQIGAQSAVWSSALGEWKPMCDVAALATVLSSV